MNVKAKRGTMHAGAAVGLAKGNLTASGLTVNTTMTHAGGGALYLGGVCGESESKTVDSNVMHTINISTTTVNCNITGNASHADALNIGGVIGRISNSSNTTVAWDFTDVTVKGTINSTWGVENNRIGGLVAVISGCTVGTSETLRQLNLSDIKVQGLSISASKTGDGDTSKAPKTMGGLLGYAWYNVHADFDRIAVSGANTLTISNNAKDSGDMAGLVFAGSGYWTVKDKDDIMSSFRLSIACI